MLEVDRVIDRQAESELLRRAQAGDDRAFVDLCEPYRAQLWRIAASVAHGANAEDLAQEAVIRAFRALRGFRGPAPFGAWLCRIAVNAAHDHVRSAWRRRVVLFSDRSPAAQDPVGGEPHGAMEQRELQGRVRKAVAALPENQRVPIWLHYFEGYALAEVSRLYKLPEATVRSRVRAGLKRLSRELHDLFPSAEEAAGSILASHKGCST